VAARAQSLPATAVGDITPEQTERWIGKAQRRVDPLRPAMIDAGGRSRGVSARPVAHLDEAAFGAFMLSWLVPIGDDVELGHLRDGRFFLQLLNLAYQPIFDSDRDLQTGLLDGSRLELAFTNDVLQAQAAGPPGHYSMIRHHALVLHAATWWLEASARDRWLRIYRACIELLRARRTGWPSAAELMDIENAAFADFEALAGESRDAAGAAALLGNPAALRAVLDYQIAAGAAIGLLERDRQLHSSADPLAWMARQLRDVTDHDYLVEQWTALR
jgi:hypothetical protein